MQCAEIQQQYLFNNKHLCISVEKENTAKWEKLFLSENRGCVQRVVGEIAPTLPAAVSTRYLAHFAHAPQNT